MRGTQRTKQTRPRGKRASLPDTTALVLWRLNSVPRQMTVKTTLIPQNLVLKFSQWRPTLPHRNGPRAPSASAQMPCSDFGQTVLTRAHPIVDVLLHMRTRRPPIITPPPSAHQCERRRRRRRRRPWPPTRLQTAPAGAVPAPQTQMRARRRLWMRRRQPPPRPPRGYTVAVAVAGGARGSAVAPLVASSIAAAAGSTTTGGGSHGGSEADVVRWPAVRTAPAAREWAPSAAVVGVCRPPCPPMLAVGRRWPSRRRSRRRAAAVVFTAEEQARP